MITVNLTALVRRNQGGTTCFLLLALLYHCEFVAGNPHWESSACRTFSINSMTVECVFKQEKLSSCQSPPRRSAAGTKNTNKATICFQDICSNLHICKQLNPSFYTSAMFYQDPFLLYQQPPYCHSSSPTRSSSHRPSFRIDDILVSRRQPFLVTKQPTFQEPRPPPMSNANPLKFGVHSILTQRPREDIGMLQGGLAVSTWFHALKFYYKPTFLKNSLLDLYFHFLKLFYLKKSDHLAQQYPLLFYLLKNFENFCFTSFW